MSVQIALVWVLCAVAYVYGPAIAPPLLAAATSARLAFALQWLIAPGAILLCTLVTMMTRFTSVEAFDGTRTPASRFLETNLRVTQNTLERAAGVLNGGVR